MAQLLKVIGTVLLCSLFGGYMIGFGLAALFPQVDQVAYPFLTAKGQKLVAESWSYKHPGTVRRGVRQYLVDDQGNKKEVSFRVRVYAALIYMLATLLVILISLAIVMPLRQIPLSQLGQQAMTHSWVVDLAIVVMILSTMMAYAIWHVGKGLLSSW